MSDMANKKDGSTSDLILEKATELFASRGYHGTSMSAITKSAGVNKALVFYYFDSKEGLFNAVVQRVFRLELDALGAIELNPKDDAIEQMHYVIDYYLDFVEAHPEVLRLTLHEVARPDGKHEIIAHQNKIIWEYLAHHMRHFKAKHPATVEHLYLSVAGAITYPHSHAPVLTAVGHAFNTDDAARKSRREHIHWLLDLVLTQLEYDDSAEA